MRLVSFLGTNDYTEVTYALPGTDQTCASRYVQEALVSHYDITEVVILVTPEARDMHADAVGEVLRPCGVPLEFNSIANPVDEASQWALFEALAEAVGDARKAVLDVTHSFRSVPLIGVAAALYLEKLHGLTVEPIVYGHFDKATSTGMVVELGSFLSLIKLTYGADIFERTGDARPLQRQLSRHPDNDTSPVLHNLGHMSDALHLLQGPALARSAKHLHQSVSFYRPTTPRTTAEHALVRHVDEAFAPFRNSGPLQVQLEQVRYYTDRRAWSAALIAVVELIVTCVCHAANLQTRAKANRKRARVMLNPKKCSAEDFPANQRLRDHYSTLNDYRNRVSHNAQGRSIKGDVQALSRQIETALKDFLEDAPTLLKDYL